MKFRNLKVLITHLLWTASLLALGLAARAGVLVTGIHSFQGFPFGENPHDALTLGSDGNFYGTTLSGGTNAGFGAVFKVTPGGVPTTLYAFTGGNDGSHPFAALVQGKGGDFYGVTEGGGTNKDGTVYKISPAGTFTSLYSFNGASDGQYPFAGLIQGADSNFYGTSSYGGTNGGGTVFKITSAGALTTLYTFTGGEDGARPQAALLQTSDGNFYGVTSSGGAYTNDGTVFEIGTNGSFSTLYSFTGGADGSDPIGALVQGLDGYLYGTTRGGGSTNNAGVVFKISPGGSFSNLYAFTGGNDGAGPTAGLTPGADGNFYGTTVAGGTNNAGTVFTIGPNGGLTSLYSFGNGGADSWAGLTLGPDGDFYGTTIFGGLGDGGTIYKISSTGELATVYDFLGGADGANSQAPLVQDSDGDFYGTTEAGGTNGGFGTIFKIGTNGTFASLYSFTGGADGANPDHGLTLGTDGNYYGDTLAGGTNDFGSVFKISRTGALNSYYSFSGGADGYYPDAGLTLGNDGNFYGTTVYGGVDGTGNVFVIGAIGAATNVYSFVNADDGGYPEAGLIQDSKGNLYGTTVEGGSNGYGAVFELTSACTLIQIYSFTNGTDGAYPVSGLVQDTDGTLYGTANQGGTNGDGTVFKISNTGLFTEMYSFTNGADGSSPDAGLVQGTDGNFYSTASSGGANGLGTLFSISSSGLFTALYSFTGGSDGAGPVATLTLGSDGSFYGTTQRGGQGNNGTVFKMTLTASPPPPPVLQSVTLTQNTLALTWSTIPGVIYQLEYTGDLSSATWTNLGPPVTAAGSTFTTSDFTTNAVQRFYRVQVVP